MRHVLKGSLLVLTLIIAQFSLAESVFRLEVTNKNGKITNAYSTMVAKDKFVTDLKAVNAAEHIALIESGGAKLVAQLIGKDESKSLALLKVGKVTGVPITITKDPVDVGRTVYLLKSGDKKIKNTISSIGKADEVQLSKAYKHNALYSKGEWGVPLINNCGELLGISIAQKTFLKGLVAPKHVAFATYSDQLRAFLIDNAVGETNSTTVCLTEEEQLKQDMLKKEKALKEQKQKDIDKIKKQQAEDDKKRKERADKKIKEDKAKKAAEDKKIEEEKKKAEEESKKVIDEATKKAEEETKKAEEEKKKAEEAKAKAEEQAKQKKILIIAAAVVLVLLAIIFMLVLAKRKKLQRQTEVDLEQERNMKAGLAQQAQSLQRELQDANKTFNDIVLQGEDANGQAIRLKIIGDALAKKGEQTIGRESAIVDYVISAEEISRTHTKIILKGGEVFVQDLGSSWGTFVNNVKADNGQQLPMPNGSVLKLSSIELTVRYL